MLKRPEMFILRALLRFTMYQQSKFTQKLAFNVLQTHANCTLCTLPRTSHDIQKARKGLKKKRIQAFHTGFHLTNETELCKSKEQLVAWEHNLCITHVLCSNRARLALLFCDHDKWTILLTIRPLIGLFSLICQSFLAADSITKDSFILPAHVLGCVNE